MGEIVGDFMTGRDYTCAHCGGKFVTIYPEEVAREELKRKFGTTPEETECCLICDTCWKELGLADEIEC